MSPSTARKSSASRPRTSAAPAPRGASGLRKTALAGLTLLASLLALDLGVSVLALDGDRLGTRLLPPYGDRLDEREQGWVSAHLESTGQNAPGIFDAELGWTRRANYVSADGRSRYNSLGARGAREYAPDPPAGVLRLATFGESFTQGAEVADEGTFQAQLEARDPRLEVPNFGVNGYGTDQALLRFRRKAPRLRAQVAVMGIMLENIGRNVNRYRRLWQPGYTLPAAKPRFVLAAGRLELVPMSFSSSAEMFDAVTDGTVAGRLREHEHWADPDLPGILWKSSLVRLGVAWNDASRRDYRRLWNDREGEPYRVTMALLEAFDREARAWGAEHVLVLVFPLRKDLTAFHRTGERSWQPLLDGLAELDLTAIDLATPLAELYPDSLEEDGSSRLYGGTHLDVEGNALVAEVLAGWVRARDLLPLAGH